MRSLLLILALTSCAGSQKPPCTEASVSALRALYTKAASDVISRGECDKYTRVEFCPAYALIEKHFELVSKELCR